MKNIILIGMPGAGKSTVGVILAKALGYDFLDTDLLISRQTGQTLQNILNTYGIKFFLRAEEDAALSTNCHNTIIATGGSMVLSKKAMLHLKKDAVTVFLDVPLFKLRRRLYNMKTRGIVIGKNQTLDDIYRERLPLYQKYADFTVSANNGKMRNTEATVEAVLQKLPEFMKT